MCALRSPSTVASPPSAPELPWPINSSLTLLLTASFLSSHPSLLILRTVLASLVHLNLSAPTPTLLVHDRLPPGRRTGAARSDKDAYRRYLRRVRVLASNYHLEAGAVRELVLRFVLCPAQERVGTARLGGTVLCAFQHITSEFVLKLEQDVVFTRELGVCP